MKKILLITFALISIIGMSQMIQETVFYRIGNADVNYKVKDKALPLGCGITPSHRYPILAYYEKNKDNYKNWSMKKNIFSADSTLLTDMRLVITSNSTTDYFELIGMDFNVKINMESSFIVKENSDLIMFVTIGNDNSVTYYEIKR